MNRPHVICHMASTINGKIISANWGNDRQAYGSLYEQCHQSFESQAWMCGRVTMEKDFVKDELPRLTEPKSPVAREAFIGDKDATSFAIAVDAKGKLGWKNNDISGDHIIEVLTEEVGDAYLHFLQERQISYVFAGKSDIDFRLALEQLGSLFPIKTIMLEGGGHINGALLQAGLVDEVSLLLLPIADATPDTPTTFEMAESGEGKVNTRKMSLSEVRQMDEGVLWLKYQAVNNKH